VRILTASNAEEGLKVLKAGSVQLIVSDYRMPGMDGVSFLKEARRLAPNVARVLLTAHPRMAVAMPEVEQAGIHQVLVKPMASDALVRSVQEIFRRKGHDDLVPVAKKQLVDQAENPIR
jgi:DNA-binding NtrC family response regulator